MSGVLGMILAGGEGSRLRPLTQSRSKPAVPFGGSYRLVDFVLNNFLNADLLRIYVLTQFKSQSLHTHMKQAWNISTITDRFIDTIPAQMRTGKDWYQGTADSIYQNLSFIKAVDPSEVCIFGSDHIYKMDIRKMLDFHKEHQAVMTVSALRMPLEVASSFGVIEVAADGRMIGFAEKPANPKSIPGDPEHALVSMGNYVFAAETLYKELEQDALNPDSSHDFGKDIIPKLYPKQPVYVYDFSLQHIKGETQGVYWRDVGTIDAYWQANMDLVCDNPPFTLNNPKWPLHTFYPALPPATFIDKEKCRARVINSLVSAGCYINAAIVDHCILGFACQIGFCTTISESVLLGNIKIGKRCSIQRAIIDKDVEIADGTIIGENLEEDRKKYTVTKSGIVVIPKGARIGFAE